MVPYQTSDTTLFMSSIAQFNSLFELFSSSQTLNILTFVMQLLDERMEQYNVFPVSRMGHYLIVTSGNLQLLIISIISQSVFTICNNIFPHWSTTLVRFTHNTHNNLKTIDIFSSDIILLSSDLDLQMILIPTYNM